MQNLFLMAVLVVAAGFSQSVVAVERIDEPLTFKHGINWKSNHVLAFERLDVAKYVAEDDINTRKGQPLRVAIARTEKSGEHFEQQGEWSTIDDMSVWRLKVNATNAEWVSFAFDDLFLPAGASLYIYNTGREQVVGPFTDKDNKSSRKLWTPMVYGDVAYVEINVPTKMKPYLSFNLAKVNQGYRNLKSNRAQVAGACNIDVVCPQGDDWRDEIRSVAHFVFARSSGDLFICTGNLVNNAEGDRKPYFLTANHCVSTAAEVQSMVLFWNFEKSMCGGIADGSQAQSQSGARLLATVGSLDGPQPQRDMTLVELDATPPESYNVRWSGWDASAIPPSSGVSIHHPNGTEKRISVDSGPIAITNYASGFENPNGTHLRISAWDEGTTEGGSSGAGFWNSDKRLVGVLSGGFASCDAPGEPDWYAHLGSHYDVGTTPATRLKAWLDPTNTGMTQVDGVESCDDPDVSFSFNPEAPQVNQDVTFTSLVSGPTVAGTLYAWDFDNNGTVDSTEQFPVFAYSDIYIGNVTLSVTSSVNSCTGSASASIIVEHEGGNNPPEAVASSLASANEGAQVSLDATGGIGDPDGDSVTFLWAQTAGPAAMIENATAAEATATLPMVTTDTVLTFQVTVTDVFGASDTASVDVMAVNVNQAPTAIVGNTTLSINEGDTVTLNAGASNDPDNDALSFSWAQTSGTPVTLSDTTAASTMFTAPQVTSNATLVFAVTVTDAPGLTDTAMINVTVNDVPPPVIDNGGGGGGALGLPLIILMAIAYLRRMRRTLQSFFVVAGCSVLFACGTADTSPADEKSDGVESAVTAQKVEEGNHVIVLRRGVEKSVAKITDSEHVVTMTKALQNRERRYEKIKPVFEYEFKIVVDGATETWMVNSTGYIQQEKSYELYKMDVSALKDYMK